MSSCKSSKLGPRRVRELAPHQPQYRLLIAEDHLENQQLLTQLMESVGFEVQLAQNGKLALERWRSWKPHLIWMDLQMPVMNGYEATAAIRAEEENLKQKASMSKHPSEHCIILALTASAFEETRTATLEAGFDDFIRKPFEASLLFSKLHQYLGVEYIYEDPEGDLQRTGPLNPPGLSDMNQQLRAMPLTWLQHLNKAALMGNEIEIERLISEINPHHQNLSEQLWEWHQLLRFDCILEFLNPVLKNSYSSIE